MVGIRVRIAVLVFVAAHVSLWEYGKAQSFNITPITIQSVYEMNGEKCVIQEAAFSTEQSRSSNETLLLLPPGTILHDEVISGAAFRSAFAFNQECSDSDGNTTCTLSLKLTKSLCGGSTEALTGRHYIRYTNVHATGISAIRILTDTGDILKELTGASLSYSGYYTMREEQKTGTVEFQYNITDLDHFGFDFIVDACCATVE